MGRRGRGGGRGNRSNNGNRDAPNGVWAEMTPANKSNEMFETYYKGQDILPEEEWSLFYDSLRSDLPTTFRVTGSRAHAEVINDTIKEKYLPHMQNVEWEGKKYDPPIQLPWYPGNLAWQISAPKRVVRKSEPFKRFQRFLVGETEVGNLSRQEAVSMIPPLLMGVEPHHKCLDMCAAPGSKTAQILEALNPHHTNSSGLLIANDADFKRTHMLVHQTARMPSKGLVVTNLDASLIPKISLGKGETLQFDRILADVPCSGDGTMRKNLAIWNTWTCNDGNSLHSLQLRILLKAMTLLRPGGRLVYSTCSFNPIENEAVVAAALNSNPGQFLIIDCADQLPELKRRHGLSTWKVATQSSNKKITWHESAEAQKRHAQSNTPEGDKLRIMPDSAWPPANASELKLDRCLRLFPHDQDTGAFFVCVLERKQSSEPLKVELPTVPAMDDVTVADEAGPSSAKRAASPSTLVEGEAESKRTKLDGEAKTPSASEVSAKKPKRDIGFKELPYSYCDPEKPEIQTIINYFGLKKDFPRHHLLVRNEYGDPVRTIYLTNELVKKIIENNDYTRIRMISAGVRAFARQDSSLKTEFPCKWRIPSDGISELVPHLPEGKVVDETIDTLKVFLKEQYPTFEQFSSKSQAWMKEAPLGNIVVRFMPGSIAGGHLSLPLHMPVWKAKFSLSLLVDKKEKVVLSMRVFGEDLCSFGQPLKTLNATAGGVEQRDDSLDVEREGGQEEESLNA